MPRVLIVGRTLLCCEALARSFSTSPNVTVVGVASGSEDAVRKADRLRPDVLLADLTVREARPLLKALGRISPETHVVAYGVPEAEASVVAWAEAGAAGCLTDSASLAELPSAVERAGRGETVCSPQVAPLLFLHVAAMAAERSRDTSRANLTTREQEILRLLAEGMANKEIARTLYISVPTVKNHLHHMFAKLGVDCRTQAVAWARSTSFASDGDQLQGSVTAGGGGRGAHQLKVNPVFDGAPGTMSVRAAVGGNLGGAALEQVAVPEGSRPSANRSLDRARAKN